MVLEDLAISQWGERGEEKESPRGGITPAMVGMVTIDHLGGGSLIR